MLSNEWDISNMFTSFKFQWSWWMMKQNESKIQAYQRNCVHELTEIKKKTFSRPAQAQPTKFHHL